MEASEKISEYLKRIDNLTREEYKVANKARERGIDPEESVEIILAENMAERVEGLISIIAPQVKGSGVIDRIFELEKEYGKLDWRVALRISLEAAQERFCKFKNKTEAMEVGIRIGIAYLTFGVVSSPLEGFVRLEIKKRKDKGEYFCLYYSGPIRSAGNTIVSVSLVIADYIRKEMGYDVYDPTNEEIKRMATEIRDYHERIVNLQYFPDAREVEFIVKNLPVQVNGDASEKLEVSNYKGLERIETDHIRNGPCLVLGEGITQKAPKVWKQLKEWGKDFGLGHWKFLEEFLVLQKKIKAREEKTSEKEIVPDFTYIKDLVAGRPILTHPLRKGGFRLRYGRCRISGLSSMAMHPATMMLLERYIATGTQLRYERPGKSSAMAPCDSIEGPIVKLRDGSVLLLQSVEESERVSKDVEEIIYLGDFLVNYGEFFNRAHKLVPAGYCEEWWWLHFEEAAKNKGIIELSQLLMIDKEIIKNLFKGDFNLRAEDAIKISRRLGIPFHPRWTYHWEEISNKELIDLINWIKSGDLNRETGAVRDILLYNEDKNDAKRILELLGVQHKIRGEEILIGGDDAVALSFSLGFFDKEMNFDSLKGENVLETVKELSGVVVKNKGGTYIGARMGRPEKAKMRKLTGSPNILFPVGDEGGRLRSFQAAYELGKIRGDFPINYCDNCRRETIYSVCENCRNKAKKLFYCKGCKKNISTEECNAHGKALTYSNREIDIKHYFEIAVKNLKLKSYPELIKGVRGTSNKEHIPENLVKGILRAMYDLYVNKDGTIRYDVTEMGLTHFRPREIGTSVEKLIELGYSKDTYGDELKKDDQLLEIFPQDVILPACEESGDEGADKVLFNVANFVDDLLVRFYGLKAFYNLKRSEDLVGHLIIGLAPHISGAIVGRVIGYTKTQGCFANPMWHAAMRRDLEGDETSIMLLMDALLNFSRKYLPDHRGATQDAPLVLTSKLTPSEVDDMVFDMDVVWKYPLELYEAAEKYKEPWEIKIEQLDDRLGKVGQYEGFGFTHDVSDLNMGVRYSAYKSLPTMEEKVLGQMRIAEKIRAVDTNDVARLVVEKHFIRDILGNLRKFSQQQFRCVKCNEKYRRPPLLGRCLKCNGNILFTVAEGTIIKYLEPALSLAKRYNLPSYLQQSLELAKLKIESVFSKDVEKQEGLGKWFG